MSTCGNDTLVFLHVAKTGGYWACEAMKRGGIELEQEMPEVFHANLGEIEIGGRFAFAFVREPLSWCGSNWQYRRRQGLPREQWPDTWADLPFPDYLSTCVDRDPGFLSRYYELYVGPPDDEIDFVGRYENLVEDLVTGLRLAGQAFDEQAFRSVAPVNVSQPPPACPAEVQDRFAASEHVAYARFYARRFDDRRSPA